MQISNLNKSLQSYDEIASTMKFRDKSRKLVCVDEENAKIDGDQFHVIFNSESNEDCYHEIKTKQKSFVIELAEELLFP